ncbi:MAG: transcriptional repressor [Candidatus Eisenbacteria bacterium]|uniref:Transcriptional repressor n=1 Tax=Eiseniibacteriota bacterium TaxID=2212470 RepID=A0A938BRH5_UNCEI|nr:transcriptional repressor [Candidatus Eisenbacteria bacterium]
MNSVAVGRTERQAAAPVGMSLRDAARVLRRVNLKVTRSRVAILDLLAERQTHMSADEITAELRAGGHAVDRVTVYRNIDRLLENGILATVLVPGRAMRVGLRRNPGSSHHHFIVCRKTGRVAEVDSRFLEQCWDSARQRIKQENGWDLSGYVMQYEGLSPEAQGNGGNGGNGGA